MAALPGVLTVATLQQLGGAEAAAATGLVEAQLVELTLLPRAAGWPGLCLLLSGRQAALPLPWLPGVVISVMEPVPSPSRVSSQTWSPGPG